MDSSQLVSIIGAGGGGAVLLALINGLIKWLSGASAREREKNTDLATQRSNAIEERDHAEKERDEADKRRRQAYEYASRLRRQLFEHGIKPEAWPTDHNGPDKTTVPTNKEKSDG